MMKKYISENSELMKEWDWEANNKAGLDPNKLTEGSNKKVWWICLKNHNYKQSINRRTSRGYSCPYCSGHKALSGYNDFATKYPAIAKEWHPTKNGNFKPSDFTYGSGKRVWWKCPVGHEYQATIRDRGIGKTNCPICNTRNETSFPEQTIFYYIKKVFPDAINKYDKIFKTSMELDIYIPSRKFAIEYDGAHWHRTEDEHKREVKKYQFCKEHNITLCRVKEHTTNHWENVADIVYYLKKIKGQDFTELENTILSIIKNITNSQNTSLKTDINIARDKTAIQNYLSRIKNSLIELRPEVAKKWNYERNGNLKPNMFSVSSNEIVWWKCPDCGHEWKSSINGMTRDGRYGCAICALKHRGKTFTKGVVKKRGSLAENMPELAKEWHPTKNGTLTANDITAGRFKAIWWLCPKCGYEWQAPPNNRKKGVGCPCCSGRVPKRGVNDLATVDPEIAKEWNYEKNAPLTPRDVLPGSGRKVWWKCHDCGYEWKVEVRRRVKERKCPNCKGLPMLPLKY